MQTIRAQVSNVLAEELHERSKGHHNTVFHELRDSPHLPAQEKNVERLAQEGQVLVLAGSETTAKTLSIIWYHLLDDPKRLQKARTEIETLPVRASWGELQRLPYLSAVVNEGLRLNFGITGRTQVCFLNHGPLLREDLY